MNSRCIAALRFGEQNGHLGFPFTVPAGFVQMPGRMRPIIGRCNETMFHRVPMNVIHVGCKVVFVADGMLPIAGLPDTAFAFATVGFQVWWQTPREARFRKPKPVHKVKIILRQGPEHMHMIGQNADGDGFDRVMGRHVAIRCAEIVDIPNQCVRPPVIEAQRKDVCSARHIKTTIVRHASNIS